MRRISIIASTILLSPIALGAQENPFQLTGGSIKSAYIVYDVTGPQQQGAGSSYELGVTPDRWLMKMAGPVDLGGKRETMSTLIAQTKDSQYTYLKLGAAPADAKVEVILRPYLAKEYAALDAAGQSRFKENLKLARHTSATGISSQGDEYITLNGQKKGSETIAGHKCDVYQSEKTTVCVLPQAPGVILRSLDAEQGTILVAKKVTLNGPVPTVAAFLPKGMRWKKEGFAYEEFAPALWEFKKQSDSRKVPLPALAKFAVAYLASSQAGQELREAQGPLGETGEAEPGDTTE